MLNWEDREELFLEDPSFASDCRGISSSFLVLTSVVQLMNDGLCYSTLRIQYNATLGVCQLSIHRMLSLIYDMLIDPIPLRGEEISPFWTLDTLIKPMYTSKSTAEDGKSSSGRRCRIFLIILRLLGCTFTYTLRTTTRFLSWSYTFIWTILDGPASRRARDIL